ncbi:hypothetical protein V1523DRAFT_436303 [Lipomyces doorenjongii]
MKTIRAAALLPRLHMRAAVARSARHRANPRHPKLCARSNSRAAPDGCAAEVSSGNPGFQLLHHEDVSLTAEISSTTYLTVITPEIIRNPTWAAFGLLPKCTNWICALQPRILSLLNATNNYTYTAVIQGLPAALYPLHQYQTISFASLSVLGGIIRTPYPSAGEIVISLTIPVINVSKERTTDDQETGYMTAIFNARMLSAIVSDTSSLNQWAQLSVLGPYPDGVVEGPTSFIYLLPPTYTRILHSGLIQPSVKL